MRRTTNKIFQGRDSALFKLRAVIVDMAPSRKGGMSKVSQVW